MKINNNIRILHLEDKRSDADIVKRELDKSDIQFELLWVTNKTDFQKALKDFPVDIILSDHSLPSFGSLQAIKMTKEEKIDVPFILITATMSDEAAVDLMKEGIADYIIKDRLQRLPKAILNAIEKKTRELQREFDNNNLNALINNTGDLMWSVDINFNLITSNQPFDEMGKINFGRAIEKGRSTLSAAYTKEMRDHFKQLYERAFRGEAFTEIEHFTQPVELWTEISYYPIRQGNEIIGTACHSRDITNIKLAERKLRHSENQLRNFAKHLNRIQEEERAHFARELHDELGQQLAGIKMGLSLITMLKDKDKMIEKAANVSKDVDEAINSMRKVATELRPGILDTLGLIASLEWLADEFERKKGIKCTIKSTTRELRFEKNISTCFFRVCQESLTNIFKHAKADEVKIEVSQNEQELILTITDNGKGISKETLDNPFSMGLLGMRERANVIGGDLTVSSNINSGTTIQLKAVLNKAMNEAINVK